MYYNENTTIFFNGEFIKVKEIPVSIFNQTMHYGNGVFEGIRAYDTPNGVQIFKAMEHYDRLHYSAKVMHINLSYSSNKFLYFSGLYSIVMIIFLIIASNSCIDKLFMDNNSLW